MDAYIWLFLLLCCSSQGKMSPLSGCPTSCKCYPEGEVDCSSQWFVGTLAPPVFSEMPATFELSLDHNRISSIAARVFAPLSSLQILNLNDNEIQSLDAEAFFGLKHLRFLDMRNNFITQLPVGLFIHQRGLFSLDLRRNRLAQLDLRVMSPLVSLEHLALGDNPLLCDCRLRELLTWVTILNLSEGYTPIRCGQPRELQGKPWTVIAHVCPVPVVNLSSSNNKNTTETSTSFSTFITNTINDFISTEVTSTEGPSSKSDNTLELTRPSEPMFTTNDSVYTSTLLTAIHYVSTPPSVQTAANSTNNTVITNLYASEKDSTYYSIVISIVAVTVLVILAVLLYVIYRRRRKLTTFKVVQDENARSVPPPGKGQELLYDNDEDEEEGYEYVDLGKGNDTARYVSLTQENHTRIK